MLEVNYIKMTSIQSSITLTGLRIYYVKYHTVDVNLAWDKKWRF